MTTEITPSVVAWDFAKLLVPVTVAWVIATRRARKTTEEKLGSAVIQSSVDGAVKDLEARLGLRFDGLEADMERASQESVKRMARMDFVLFGVDGRGGMVEESERVRRRIEEEHEVLLNVNGLVRELYRRVVREEPPLPPPTISREWRNLKHPDSLL
jgi:hypothetical protein